MRWPQNKREEARWLIDSLEASARRRARLNFACRGSLRLISVLDASSREASRERRRSARTARHLSKLLPGGRRSLALKIIRHAYRSEQAMLASAVVESAGGKTSGIDFIVAEHQGHLASVRREAMRSIDHSLSLDLLRRADGGPGH